jgi:hypothetical protein
VIPTDFRIHIYRIKVSYKNPLRYCTLESELKKWYFILLNCKIHSSMSNSSHSVFLTRFTYHIQNFLACMSFFSFFITFNADSHLIIHCNPHTHTHRHTELSTVSTRGWDSRNTTNSFSLLNLSKMFAVVGYFCHFCYSLSIPPTLSGFSHFLRNNVLLYIYLFFALIHCALTHNMWTFWKSVSELKYR